MPRDDHPYLSIIVKPTYSCNLACSYCSVECHDSSAVMSFEMVDRLFERATSFCGTDRTLYLVWHGGEPLLMGPSFFDYVGSATKQYAGVRIVNSLQSNATLLNDEFVEVIVRHGFRFSTSFWCEMRSKGLLPLGLD